MTPETSTTPTVQQLEVALGRAYADLARVKAANKGKPESQKTPTGAIERRITQLSKLLDEKANE